MSDLAKLFPIIAFAAIPIFIFLIWSFCGGSVDFMDLAQGIPSESALTEEERAEARRAMEVNLITTQFEMPTSDATASDNMELGNHEDNEEPGLSSSSSPACSICLAQYRENDFVSQSTNPDCDHLFHKECIIEWLVARVGQTAECPICRREFRAHTSDDMTDGCVADENNSDCTEAPYSPATDRTSISRRSFGSGSSPV